MGTVEERPSRTLTEDDEKQFTCVYFGFASNLSPRSLQQRCPGALYIGLARLQAWRFIISETGFGNIVPGKDDDVVYGSLHFLTRQHEAALDKSEEVPNWHQKKNIKVTRLAAKQEAGDIQLVDLDEIEVMTYIDFERTTEGHISKEYIFLMRKALADGIKCGVPAEYFQKYLQKFLPEDDTVGLDEKVVMQRTIQVDREDLKYVPRDILKLAKHDA